MHSGGCNMPNSQTFGVYDRDGNLVGIHQVANGANTP
jgi:hypothetical protein